MRARFGPHPLGAETGESSIQVSAAIAHPDPWSYVLRDGPKHASSGVRAVCPRMKEQVLRWSKASASWLERVLAVALLAGTLFFAVASVATLSHADFHSTDTFYEVIYRVLVLVIGIELARTLVTHDLDSILELLAFVVARKILKPDVTAPDILFSVAAFIGLLAARKHLLNAVA